MAWRSALSDNAEDNYYVSELRHALTTIVRGGLAIALKRTNIIDSAELCQLEPLPLQPLLHRTVDQLRGARSFVLTKN